MSGTFAPYALIRIAGLPYEAVEGLRAPATVKLLDALHALAEERRALAVRLNDVLYGLVPAIEDRRLRARVLRLQRDLHNDRQPREEVTGLPDDASAALRTLAENWRSVRALEERLAATHRADHERIRGHLRKLAADPELLRAAQLSHPALVMNLERYAASPDCSDKRSRTTELSLVNYVTRMAIKPSPFSSFARTRLAVRGAPPSVSSRIRVARFARMVVMWVQRSMADHPELRPYSWIRSANTLRVDGDRADWLRRGMDGSRTPATAEKAAAITLTPPVRTLLDTLASAGRVRHHELVARCGEGQGWAALIDKAIAIGLLECFFGGGDQTEDLIGDLLDDLAGIPGPTAARLGEALRELRDLEGRLALADAAERALIARRSTELLEAIAALLGVEPPELGEARTLFYEDVAESATAPFPERWHEHTETLDALQRFLSIFDDNLHPRPTLATMFVERFGPQARPSLLEAYHWFCRIPVAEVQRRMLDLRAAHTATLRARQNRILDRLRELAADDPEEIVLDPRELAATRHPAFVPPCPAISWFGQFAELPDGPLLVLNQAGTGFGKQFSRFCALFEHHARLGTLIGEQVAAAEETLGGRLTDLVAALGMNVNLHPPLYGVQLEYPGSRAIGGNGPVLRLDQVELRYDPDRHRVTTWERDAPGRELLLTPLNFLLPDLGPPLYRFLNLLSREQVLTVNLWERVDQRRPEGRDTGIRRYPRLRAGRVVLDRRTWKIPVAALPPLPPGNGPEVIRAARAWQREVGLPDQVFCRSATLPDPLAAEQRQRDRWTEVLRVRGGTARKPQFVDFTSIPLVHAFAKLLRQVTTELTVQEFLPGAETLRGEGEAREYVVELYREAADDARS